MDRWDVWKLDALVTAVRAARAGCDGTCVVGIAGPPAAGKSTLAQELCAVLNGDDPRAAQVCPMDGFHLTHAELEARGLSRFKGRADTFDVHGFVEHLRRIRLGLRGFTWPLYSRTAHEVVPEGMVIDASARVFVVEGNYLLLPDGGWEAVRELLDLAIFLTVDDSVMRARLLDRHMHGGRSEEDALVKIERTDVGNAAAVNGTQVVADIVLGERAPAR